MSKHRVSTLTIKFSITKFLGNVKATPAADLWSQCLETQSFPNESAWPMRITDKEKSSENKSFWVVNDKRVRRYVFATENHAVVFGFSRKFLGIPEKFREKPNTTAWLSKACRCLFLQRYIGTSSLSGLWKFTGDFLMLYDSDPSSKWIPNEDAVVKIHKAWWKTRTLSLYSRRSVPSEIQCRKILSRLSRSSTPLTIRAHTI